MNNLKLIGKREEQLKNQVETVKNFSDDIHKEFQLLKCAKKINLFAQFNTLYKQRNTTA